MNCSLDSGTTNKNSTKNYTTILEVLKHFKLHSIFYLKIEKIEKK